MKGQQINRPMLIMQAMLGPSLTWYTKLFVRSIKLTFNIIFLFHHFQHFSSPPPGREERMLKMMEKKNNDKGELIERTAWFTRLGQSLNSDV